MTVVEPGHRFADNARLLRELNSDKRINIYEGKIEDLYDVIGSFKYDYIVISALLHEVEYPEKILLSILKLCSPTTIVHINTPNAMSLHRLIAKEMGLINDVHQVSNLGKRLQQSRVYDFKQMENFLIKSGFKVIEKGSYMPKFLSYAQMEIMLKEHIIDESYFEGLYALSEFIPDYGSEIYFQVRKE